jgi:hypothetical protein
VNLASPDEPEDLKGKQRQKTLPFVMAIQFLVVAIEKPIREWDSLSSCPNCK